MQAETLPTRLEGVAPASAPDYNAFLAGIELVSVRLARAEVSAPVIYVENPERKLSYRLSTSAKYANFISGFMVTARLHFDGFYSENAEADVEVDLSMELIYTSPVPMPDEVFVLFENRNLPLNVWPYYREFLQSALGRTGWPIFTLPVFKSGWNAAAVADPVVAARADISTDISADKKQKSTSRKRQPRKSAKKSAEPG